MKITGKTYLPATISSTSVKPFAADSDPLQKPSSRKTTQRKTRNPGYSGAGVRLKREGAPAGKRSRPETPLLRWKVDDGREKGVSSEDEKPMPEFGRRSGRKPRGGREVVVSARKLAAGLWRLQPPEVPNNGGERCSLPKKERLGIKLEPSFHFSNSAMEGATKWDPDCWRTSEEVKRIYGQSKLKHHIDEQVGVVAAVAALEVELEQARTHIQELETEQHSSKKKLEHFLKKLSEERAMWRSREHEKIRVVIDDIKSDLNRERKTRKRMEMVNSKLANELADVKLSAKRFMQEYEKERKARELTEVVCDELAKEIGDDKAEFEALKRESMKLREEVEDERKMLQMAEVWREERVQMKLVDVKLAVEEEFSKMSKLVVDLETFLRSTKVDSEEEIRKAEILHQVAASVNIKDIKDFSYEPANPDIFSVFEDVNFGETEAKEFNKDGIQSSYLDGNGEIEEDGESGWETVSHPEDHGSSYSPDGSDPSVNKFRRDSNASGSGTYSEEEETGISEISEVRSVPTRPLKKVASKSRVWRSFPSNGEKFVWVDGKNGRLSSGRGVVMSPDQWSSSPELAGNGNPHVTRGIKGCIEWPHGAMQQQQQQQQNKNSLKAKLMEAKMESQKIQLRHVLKHKI